MHKPLAIDIFCGLGGWTDGLLAEGYDVVGFDIEQHVYGEHRYPAQLVVQDVLTLHGSQFKNATLIVASPPCQEYSYMAMPWSRAKAIAADYRSGKRDVKQLTALFDACFRIQREASAAAGRHIPMVVENVKGAQPWVGRARWSFGSFYLWGDVPALMPVVAKAAKVPGFRFDGSGGSFQTASVKHSTGVKVTGIPHIRDGEPHTKHLTNPAEHIKNTGGSWFNIAHNTTSGKGQNPDGRKRKDADGYERTHPNAFGWKSPRTSSGSSGTKTADGRKYKGDWFRDPNCPTRQGGQKGRKYDTQDGLKQPGINLSDIGFNVANAHQFGHMVEGVKIKRSDEDKRQHIGAKRKFASAMIAKIPLPLSRHIAATYRPAEARAA